MGLSVDIGLLEFYFGHQFSGKKTQNIDVVFIVFILQWIYLASNQILNYIRSGLYMDKKISKFLRTPAHMKLNIHM